MTVVGRLESVPPRSLWEHEEWGFSEIAESKWLPDFLPYQVQGAVQKA